MSAQQTNEAIIASHERLVAELDEKRKAAERDSLAATGAPTFLEMARRNIAALLGNVEAVANAGEMTKDERVKIKKWLARALEAVDQATAQAARGAEQCAGAAAAYAIAVKSSRTVIAEAQHRNESIQAGLADGSIVELEGGGLVQTRKGTPRPAGVAPASRIRDTVSEPESADSAEKAPEKAETTRERPSKPKRVAKAAAKTKARRKPSVASSRSPRRRE